MAGRPRAWNLWRRRAGDLAPAALTLFLLYVVNFGIAYFDAERQLALGWGALALLFVMSRLPMFKRPPWRFVFILVSAFLAWRYLVWRSTVSLVYTGPLDFAGMLLLYLAEAYTLVLHFLGLFVNLWPMRNRPALLPTEASLYPTVDVFVPTYDEDDEIIRTTVIAASQMDYPRDKLRIHICDDGGTLNKRFHPAAGEDAWKRHYRLRNMARELGVNYITRESNRAAKAGNINHALRITSGDLVLVLDCDHVPTRDFLTRTVEYFLADPKLFLVQTPHFFINPSPVEMSLAGTGNPNAESDLFYREIHRSLDFWNASYFCGSAAVLRREHLDKVGGVSGETITEDAETALKLHALGYNSAYMDMPMVCGLAPDNYDNYVLQRSRWAQGMTQMLLLHNPLTLPGLSLQQRLCYFNSCYFWLFGFARITFYVAPAFFLLFGLKIYAISVEQVLSLALPFVFSTFVVMDYFYGRTRQPLFSELYESIQATFLLPAVVSVFLNPRKPVFKVTQKGQRQEQEFLNGRAMFFFIIIVICWLSLGAAVIRWIDFPANRDTILVTGLWCIYNLFLASAALGAFWERRQIRQHYRILVREPVRVRFPRLQQEFEATTTDISVAGLGFTTRLPHPPLRRERVYLTVPLADGSSHTFEAQLQRNASTGPDEYSCGARFLLDEAGHRAAVAFVYGNSARWLKLWMGKATNPGTLRMLRKFFLLGLKGTAVCAVQLTHTTVARLARLKNRNVAGATS